MRFRPKNPNTSWPNQHTLYVGYSGSGKSQMLNQNPVIPKRGVRVVLWDPTYDHPGDHCEDRKTFLKYLSAGIRRGGGFQVAFSGNPTLENYQWWCEVVASILDGNVLTYAKVEELSAVSRGTGAAPEEPQWLLNQGRKFGLRFHGTTQKPQEINKTYYDMCEHKYVGMQKTLAMCKKMSPEVGVEAEDIGALKPLQFYYSNGSCSKSELIEIPYKKVKNVRIIK